MGEERSTSRPLVVTITTSVLYPLWHSPVERVTGTRRSWDGRPPPCHSGKDGAAERGWKARVGEATSPPRNRRPRLPLACHHCKGGDRPGFSVAALITIGLSVVLFGGAVAFDFYKNR